jgi:hypothetical protein
LRENGEQLYDTNVSYKRIIQVYYFAHINILGEMMVAGFPVVGPPAKDMPGQARKNHSPDRETKEAAVEGRREPAMRFGLRAFDVPHQIF